MGVGRRRDRRRGLETKCRLPESKVQIKEKREDSRRRKSVTSK
mgnify:CR=1 FL=1